MRDATYERGEDGIVLVTIDMADQPVNLINDAFGAMLDAVLDRLQAERDGIAGVIVTSGKPVFVAGGDIDKILELRRAGPKAAFAYVQALKAQLRRLETLGRPVVAAINGTALGGGLELALACHHRVAIDDPKAQVGFPEVGLGLLPGAGGVVRSVRMLGLLKALPALSEGQRLTPRAASDLGLVDALATDRDDMLAQARRWIAANPEARQPWDRKGHAVPGGGMFAPENMGAMAVFSSTVFKKTRGLLPAAERILRVAGESTQVGFDAAMTIESRAFAELLMEPATESLIGTMFVQMNEIGSGASRPAGARATVRRLGVVGAGMMGRGIAHAAASAGIEVLLRDVSPEVAEKGKAHSRDLLDKAVARGRSSAAERDAVLARITPTAELADMAGCDFVIEAVFEDVALKRQVIAEVEAVVGDDVIIATNTSTLPISLLAQGARRPERFIGLHFFSPVDRMHIVEIISGAATGESCLAHAYDFVRQLRKAPIVVRDSRGFFTSRVFAVFIDEGARLLKDGVDPVVIESAARAAGMPVGPLAVQDEVMMDMLLRSWHTNRGLDRESNGAYAETYAVCGELCTFMTERGRPGRGAGAGFYDYLPGGGKRLWPGLYERFGGNSAIPFEDVRDRMMFRMVVEAARCLEEGVVTSTRDGNIGSILAFGFPMHTGGVFQFIKGAGIEAFQERSGQLTQGYGERFAVPPGLEAKLAA